MPSGTSGLEGLQVLLDFVTAEEESLLIQQLDAREWAGRGVEPNPEMKRRHQHYGGTFSYRLRRVVGDMEQLPNMFEFLTNRLLEQDIYRSSPNSIIVNEYEAGQGIMPHVDAPKLFGKTITALSLLSACVMSFRHVKDPDLVYRIHLPRRSLVVMNGSCRYEYKHSISKELVEYVDGLEIVRARRVSITYRDMVVDRGQQGPEDEGDAETTHGACSGRDGFSITSLPIPNITSIMTSLAIPTIDISPLLSSASTSEKQKVAIALLDAFTTFGVFYITSSTHPVFSSQKTAEILDATKRLFALNSTEKAHIPKIAPGGFTRGYVPLGGESGSTTMELKEGFSYGYEWPSDMLETKQAESSLNKLQGPNSWPAEDTLNQLDQGQRGAFKATLQEFYLSVCEVARGLLQGISLALQLPETELAKYCSSSETISFMRLFHYLPYADQGQSTQIGSSAHTDWGFLTLILSPCKTVGLQLFHENSWHDVPSVENTLVVNGGDYLSLLTGGKLISPLHRVVSNGLEERYSMCCFYYPDYHAKIPLLVQEGLKGQAVSGNYSLLRDQRAEEEVASDSKAHSADAEDASSVATKLLNGDINFGDYIVSKWTQVYRKGGSY
ncbi:hypothetical protein BGX28_004311 [Mortierella sp. GBA30]|nr:hypothetical protein BGX28_004311 [Mortierella sp. GBA30]